MAISLVNRMRDFEMVSFTTHEGSKENLIQSGRLTLFFNKLRSEEEAITGEEEETGLEKATEIKKAVITVLFQNLSQVMCTQGPYRGECESALKSHIYDVFESDISTTSWPDLIDQPKYKFNPYVSDVVEKIRYLLKNRFISTRKDWFVCGTRFSHHLGKTVGNLNTMSKAAAYITAGAAFFVTGLNKFYPDDPTKAPNTTVGLTSMGIGTSLFAAPFVSAIQASGTKNL